MGAGNPDPGKTRVLVVCLGNICRSPLAEAVIADIVRKRGLQDKVEVDSAGTGAYHIGEEPDPRTVKTCKDHGVPIHHFARAVKPRDFLEFDYILAADRSNLMNLDRFKPDASKAVVKLFGSYGDGRPIEDPYYGGMNGFETTFQQCVSYSNAFLDSLFPESKEAK